MKKVASIILLQLFFLNLSSQTNTFPVNDNVGIGTLQPQQKLTVVGKITSATSGNDYYGAWLDGTSANALLGLGPWHNQAGYLKWYDNSFPRRLSLYTSSSSENLTFQESGGNVGIGTTNPIKKLDVWSSENAFAASFGTTLSIGQWSGIHFGYKENGNDYYKQAGLVFERTAYNSHAPGKIHILNTISSQSATLSDAKVTIDEIGNMGIGVVSPSEKLSVNGNIKAKKVIVSQSGWPDYVFDSSYALRSLPEVEKFIAKHKHLPDIPSAKEVGEKGISIGDNQVLLLKKIEELTLHLIRQEKILAEQARKIEKLEKETKK